MRKKKAAIILSNLSMFFTILEKPLLIVFGIILMVDKDAKSATSFIEELAHLLTILDKGAHDSAYYLALASERSNFFGILCLIIGFALLVAGVASSVVLRVFLAKFQRKGPFIAPAICSMALTNGFGLASGIVVLTMNDDDFLPLTYRDM